MCCSRKVTFVDPLMQKFRLLSSPHLARRKPLTQSQPRAPPPLAQVPAVSPLPPARLTLSPPRSPAVIMFEAYSDYQGRSSFVGSGRIGERMMGRGAAGCRRRAVQRTPPLHEENQVRLLTARTPQGLSETSP